LDGSLGTSSHSLSPSTLFRHVPAQAHVVSPFREARSLVGYAAPISIYQLINAFISRLDLLMLGYFVGRAPGVTLATVGVYSAVIGTANGLRKVNQAFNPIFAPVVAGMTATGDHEIAAATYARLAQWMLWILLPLVAVLSLAGSTILLIYGPAFWQGGRGWASLLWPVLLMPLFPGRNGHHGATPAFESSAFVDHLRGRVCRASVVDSALWTDWRGSRYSSAVYRSRDSALCDPAVGISLERFLERHQPPLIAAGIAIVPALICRGFLSGIVGQVTSAAVFLAVFGVQWWQHHVHRKDKLCLARARRPKRLEKCNRFVVVVLTAVRHIVQ
jgi:hypothetical protein